MSKKLNTETISGFPEWLPEEQIVFNEMLDTIRRVYELYGFEPLETPVIERANVLLAKTGGETEKEIFRFEKSGYDMATRFDLTVPLARYVSEHYDDLTFPFRRYQIGKVYRGEKPQRGRFREFYQCDIDIIDENGLAIENDAEIPCVIYDIFNQLDFGKFIIRISNRKLVSGLMSSVGDEQATTEAMRALDKIEKIGKDGVRERLEELDLSQGMVQKLLDFVSIDGKPQEVIAKLKELEVKDSEFQEGVSELGQIVKWLQVRDIPKEAYKIDLSIVRGLDYYTGTVYETNLVEYPDIGSICSGGRYDNLASQYIDRNLPGVGISIGLTRLFSLLKDEGIIEVGASTLTKALVLPVDPDNREVALKISDSIQDQGIPVEVYNKDEDLRSALEYGNKKGIPYVIFVGDDEIESGEFTVKDMKTGDQTSIPRDNLPTYIKEKVDE